MSLLKTIDVTLARRRTARTISINRPAKRNCLNVEVLRELTITILGAPKSIIALAGEGELFCSGLDLDELHENLQRHESPAPLLEPLIILYRTVACHPAPTLSLVTGQTTAGGVGLACCVDLVVMNERASFYVPGKRSGKKKEPATNESRDETIYRPLARVFLPILMRRRQASRQTAEQWFGKSFDPSRAREWHLCEVDSKEVKPELMFRDALGRLEPLVLKSEQGGLLPRLGPDCFAEMDNAYKRVLMKSYVKKLIQHLEDRKLCKGL